MCRSYERDEEKKRRRNKRCMTFSLRRLSMLMIIFAKLRTSFRQHGSIMIAHMSRLDNEIIELYCALNLSENCCTLVFRYSTRTDITFLAMGLSLTNFKELDS